MVRKLIWQEKYDIYGDNGNVSGKNAREKRSHLGESLHIGIPLTRYRMTRQLTILMILEHCIDSIRQSLQCSADLTPVPWVGMSGSSGKISPNISQVHHKCRNWEAIHQWALYHQLEDYEQKTSGYTPNRPVKPEQGIRWRERLVIESVGAKADNLSSHSSRSTAQRVGLHSIVMTDSLINIETVKIWKGLHYSL